MFDIQGVIVKESSFTVDETIGRLVSFLQSKGLTIYARINQQAELQSAGLQIGPLEFILFGNPRAGGAIMIENPVAALDLPLKIISWQDEQKKVWLAYNEGHYIQDRYRLSAGVSAPLNLDLLVAAALSN